MAQNCTSNVKEFDVVSEPQVSFVKQEIEGCQVLVKVKEATNEKKCDPPPEWEPQQDNACLKSVVIYSNEWVMVQQLVSQSMPQKHN